VFDSDVLYYDDQYSTGATRKQSYLTDSGSVYRIAGVSDWSVQAGIRIYLGKRHVKQGVL
jgi:hypothetical protein